MPPLPEAIRRVWAPLAPRLSPRVWRHGQRWLLGALRTPGAPTVTAALRVLGVAAARRVTTDHRVLNRATWSGRQARRMLVGRLSPLLVPAGATSVLGADAPVARRFGRPSTATGGDREAGRSSKTHGRRGFGRQGGVMRRWGPGPWRRRVWAFPGLPGRCWPAEPRGQRRHHPRGAWGRPLMTPVRRWRPGRRLGLVVDGGVAASSRARACVKSQGGMGSRVRWEAALEHGPGPQLPGKRGPTPWQGTRPRRVQGGAARAATPWETAAGDWDGGTRTPWWGCSPPALWDTPRGPPGAIRVGLGCAPERQWPMAACFCTELAATPGHSVAGVVRRWSGAVTCEEPRAQLGGETPRPGSDRASARTTPVLLALVSLVPVFARRWSPDGQLPVPVTAWDHNDEPPFAAWLAWGRRPLWRARSCVTSTPAAECRPWPREAFARLIDGVPLAA
jgi:hypothetical protein